VVFLLCNKTDLFGILDFYFCVWVIRFGASICGAFDVHSQLCHTVAGDVGAGRGVHGHVLLLLALLRLHERHWPLQLRVFPTLGVPLLSFCEISHLHPHVSLITCLFPFM
jgi:hypothetical protein